MGAKRIGGVRGDEANKMRGGSKQNNYRKWAYQNDVVTTVTNFKAP
jgi:hypothetical protein